MELTSPAFSDGDPIPEQYGYTEANVNPPLDVDGVPDGAVSLVLVMDDPDAVEPAEKVWDHWVVWNVDPNTSRIPEDWSATGATEGRNDYDERGYGGPNPPDRPHTYRFRLYALDAEPAIEAGATKDDLQAAMEGHVLAESELTGTYAP
ncbi:MAG: YbhB/YbcL family Raf kinase inhibitor-like protein [Halobacteriales archaeon]